MRMRRTAPGFSILEVLIGTALLAVVALAIFTAFAIGVRALALAGGMNAALGIGEQTLAALAAGRCRAPDDIPPPADPPGTRYRREVAVIPRPEPGQWEITATVTWVQGRQRRSISLATLTYLPRVCEWVAP